MSTTTQTPESCIALGTPMVEEFHPSSARPTHAADLPAPDFPGAAPFLKRNRFFEQFRLGGIEISAEEFRELSIFDEFLGNHVRESGICSVQCMLVWNEWVRTFRRQTHEFPKLILEKEFCSVLTERFGVGVAEEDHRGTVFAGIRFVP